MEVRFKDQVVSGEGGIPSSNLATVCHCVTCLEAPEMEKRICTSPTQMSLVLARWQPEGRVSLSVLTFLTFFSKFTLIIYILIYLFFVLGQSPGTKSMTDLTLFLSSSKYIFFLMFFRCVQLDSSVICRLFFSRSALCKWDVTSIFDPLLTFCYLSRDWITFSSASSFARC